MARRLRQVNAEFELLIVDNDTPHGYLNMQSLSAETHDAFAESLEMIKQLLEVFDAGGGPRKSSTTSSTSSNKY
jgi:hypothetical protein